MLTSLSLVIAIVELAERFSFYGSSVVFVGVISSRDIAVPNLPLR